MSKEAPPELERRDVVIYALATGKIETIVAKNLAASGHRNIDSCLRVWALRINDAFDVVDVPVGKYKKGDIIEKADTQ